MAVSMSVVTQAIVFLSMACFGDFGPYRKRILVCAAMTAACCCCLFTAIKKNEHYFWAAYLLIFIEVSLGISLCMYNAYIPELARSSVEFKALMTEYKEKKGDFDPNKATKDKAAGKKVLSSTELLVRRYSLIQDQLSEIGHIWGYSGSSINVLISTVVVMATGFGGGNDKLIGGIKNAMFAMGIWWFIFTMPAVFVLRKRDGPPLPGGQTIFHYFWFSLKRSASTFVATVNYLPNTRNFMLAFFMYTDLISTISQCGILFALDEMGMTVIHFVWICIIAPCSGVFWMWFVRTNQRKRGWKTKTILLCALSVYLFQAFWGLFGFTGIIGYVYPNELFFLAFIYGGGLAVYESASRTTFCELVPPGQTAEFFGIYEITDKGSSWLGPFIISILYQETGTARLG